MGASEWTPRLALALLALGCGGETFTLGDGREPTSLPEGGPSMRADAALGPLLDAGDAARDAARVAPELRFGAPQPIAELADAESASDDDPSLTADLRALYFNSKRDGGRGREDVWYTTRAAIDEPWQAPQPAAELNTEYRETGIALSADGLTVWFSSDRPEGAGGLDVYTATRADRAAPFGEARRVESLSSEGDDLVSALDPSGRTLYFARRANEDDDYDLFIARRASLDGDWGEIAPLPGLNGDREESDAYGTRDGAYVVFTRSGDLQLAARQSDGSYAVSRALSELNSDEEERDAWFSDDLTYVVFSSDRSGTFLLYEARLEP